MRRAGQLPEPVQISSRTIAWPEHEIAELLRRRRQERTA
jgi:predicted DNA-binding transcriptional regulator AlpA